MLSSDWELMNSLDLTSFFLNLNLSSLIRTSNLFFSKRFLLCKKNKKRFRHTEKQRLFEHLTHHTHTGRIHFHIHSRALMPPATTKFSPEKKVVLILSSLVFLPFTQNISRQPIPEKLLLRMPLWRKKIKNLVSPPPRALMRNMGLKTAHGWEG